MIQIWHNNRCRKSRETLAIVEEKTSNIEVREYLKDSPSAQEIKEVLNKLGVKAENIIRKGEAEFKENFKGKSLSENEWVEAMVKYPKLIERPIVINGPKAIIGRPPENVKSIL